MGVIRRQVGRERRQSEEEREGRKEKKDKEQIDAEVPETIRKRSKTNKKR